MKSSARVQPEPADKSRLDRPTVTIRVSLFSSFLLFEKKKKKKTRRKKNDRDRSSMVIVFQSWLCSIGYWYTRHVGNSQLVEKLTIEINWLSFDNENIFQLKYLNENLLERVCEKFTWKGIESMTNIYKILARSISV